MVPPGVDIDGIAAAIKRAVQEAYDRGRADGAREMRESILRAAGASIGSPPSQGTDINRVSPPGPTDGTQRAPRGLINRVLDTYLSRYPGSTIRQAELGVIALDSRISEKSVGNTLRRLESKNYRRDGDRWYVIEDTPEKHSAEEPATNDSSADIFGPIEGG